MKKLLLFLWLALTLSCTDNQNKHTPLGLNDPVRGWIILSDNLEEGLSVIDRAPAYDINHLQLSHHVIHDLRHVREPERLDLANRSEERRVGKGGRTRSAAYHYRKRRDRQR